MELTNDFSSVGLKDDQWTVKVEHHGRETFPDGNVAKDWAGRVKEQNPDLDISLAPPSNAKL